VTEPKLDEGTQRLVDDLMQKPRSFDRDEILRRAKRFKYHDYKADHPTPEILLARHLIAAGYRDLAVRCAEGRYQQGKEEADAWLASESEETRQIANDPEMRAKMEEVFALAADRFGSLTGEQLLDATGLGDAVATQTDKGKN